MIRFDGGIHIGDEVILDPTRKKPRAFISHAHSDHLRRHRTILATAETISLARPKAGEFEGIILDTGKTYRLESCRMRLESAGHILGSSQFIIDHSQKRIVYTGDFKLGHNPICPPAEIHQCDILVMDTTFGHPAFRFPDFGEVVGRLLEFVDGCRHKGAAPIIYAYSLGKAQEIIRILNDDKIQVLAAAGICEYAAIYERHGVELGDYHLFEGQYPEDGVVLMPPGARFAGDILPGYRKKSCLVSGWAASPRFGFTKYYDQAIPLSDHASFDDLLRYAEQSEAETIYCLFGFAEIVEWLKRRGLNAMQVSLKATPKVS